MAKVKLQLESLQACNEVDNDDGNDSDHLHLSPPFHSVLCYAQTMIVSWESRKILSCVDSDHDHAAAIIINLNGSELWILMSN